MVGTARILFRWRVQGGLAVHLQLVDASPPRSIEFGRIENASDEDYQDVFGYRSPGRRFLFGVAADL